MNTWDEKYGWSNNIPTMTQSLSVTDYRLYFAKKQVRPQFKPCLFPILFSCPKHKNNIYDSFLRLKPGLRLCCTAPLTQSPFNTNQFPTKMETRPRVNSLSLFPQTSSPPTTPAFKAAARGRQPGDKLIFAAASSDNADASHPSGGGMSGLCGHKEY